MSDYRTITFRIEHTETPAQCKVSSLCLDNPTEHALIDERLHGLTDWKTAALVYRVRSNKLDDNTGLIHTETHMKKLYNGEGFQTHQHDVFPT